MNIIINPGHGKGSTGKPDPGAIAPDGTHERDICLGVASKMKGVTFIGKDENLDVNEIAKKADTLPPQIFIALHCNAAIGTAQGVEVWYETGNSDSKAAAEKILASIISKTGQKSRGVKDEKQYSQKYLRVFHDAKGTGQSKHIAVLVEMGFLSGGDLDILKNKQQLMADAILAPFQATPPPYVLTELERMTVIPTISAMYNAIETLEDSPRRKKAQEHLHLANESLRGSI